MNCTDNLPAARDLGNDCSQQQRQKAECDRQVAKLKYISRLVCPKNPKITICSMGETVFVT